MTVVQILRAIAGLVSVFLLTACDVGGKEMRLSDEERVRVVEMQNPFGDRLFKFNIAAENGFAIFGLDNCMLYKASTEGGVVVAWAKVPEVDVFYPWFSGCNNQTIEQEGAYLKVSVCKLGIGRGSGCSASGTFRSANARDWQMLDGKAWKELKSKEE